MRTKLLIFCAALLLFSGAVAAQDNRNLFQSAVDAYGNGNFDLVEELLDGKVESIASENQVQAYRLLVLSCLYRDMPEKAEVYATRLLNLDPFFMPYGDTPRFAEILAKLKKGSSTITSASKMAESLEEVPVPVTLITEDMIRASGAVRLQDLLMLYVPGLSAISGLEDNVAMRGVYGLGQETILVMLDGHRLNSPSTNSESFDFRNSIEKIKQIEVLRGPASSLYGNVALTAVVNIVTKTGSDLEGGHVSGIGGAGKSFGGTFMLGNGNIQSDYLVWGSVYNSIGEKSEAGGTTHYVEGYNSLPSFDLGAKIHWGDFNIEVMGQHGHPVPYYNLMSIGETFSYDKYGKFNGEGPGMARTNLRADVEWNHSWKDFTLSAAVCGARERMQLYNVIGDAVPYEIMEYMAHALGIASVKTNGVRQLIALDDYSFGGTLTGAYNYNFKRSGMSGSLLFGLQFEDYIAGDSSLMLGADFIETNNVKHSVMMTGVERTLSSFLQIKHYFTKKFIFNGGLRYDFKNRIDGRKLNTFSPRVSLIWMPSKVFTLKGAYSHAFVDAAVFYRGSTIPLFSGGTELNPEIMDSFQLDAILNWKDLGLKYEFNPYYNNVKDMVYYNVVGAVGAGGKAFTNAGHITMGGIENVLHYGSDRALVNVNATYQYPFKVEGISASEHSLFNVPRFLGNITAQYAVLAPANGSKLYMRANMHTQSAFDCQTNDILNIFLTGKSDPYKVPAYATFGVGLEWKWHIGLSASFDMYNLAGTRHEIGGQLLRGVPALGRSWIIRLAYNFKTGQRK